MAISRTQMKRQLYSIGGGAIKGTDAGNGREGFFRPVLGSPTADLLNTLSPNDPRHYGIGFGPRPLPMSVSPQGGEQAIYPRLGDLRSGVSSAEQELQQINQSIDQVQSTLGEGGGNTAPDLRAIPEFMKDPSYQPIQAPLLGMRPGNIPGTDAPFSSLRSQIGNGFYDNNAGLGQPLGNQSPMSAAMRNMAADGGMIGRQMYQRGGIMDVTPRENFGLGSKLKKFVRKVIPNEIADVAVKAAPFVAPFNPLIAAGMAGLGGFDQTGSISKSLRSGALTYGLGNLARVIGGAGFQGGLKAPGTGTGFGSYFTSPISGQQLFGAQAPVVDSGATVQSLDEIVGPGGGIEEYLYKTDPSKLTLGQQADIIAQQVSGGTPKTGYSDILERIVGKGSTLGERAQAIKELGGKALKDIYTTDKGKLDKTALFSTAAGVGSYIEAKKLLDDAGEDTEGYTEEMYEADKARYMEKYRELLNPEQFYATGGRVNLKGGGKSDYWETVTRMFIEAGGEKGTGMNINDFADKYFPKMQDGGRVKLETGGIPSIMLAKKEYNFMDLIDKEGEDEYYEKKAEELDRKYNPERYKQILPKEKPMDKYMLDEVMSERGMRTLSEGTRDDVMKMYAERAYKKGQISEDEYREIMGFKVGGRVGYKIGSKPKEDKEGIMSVKMEMEDEDEDNMMMADAPGITFTTSEKSYLFKTLAGQGGSDRSFTMPQLYGILNNPNSDKNIEDAKALKAFLKMKGFKTGGRVQYAMGSEVPVRENQAGVSEMDFRETGGFVPPIGVKEKADDIPAMLSNNEFVFTADAVRAAGGGSVNKGAQKMYALMKQLEGKVV